VQVLFCRKEGWAGFVGGRGAEKRAAEVKEPNAQHHPFTATKSHIFRIPSYRSEKRVRDFCAANHARLLAQSGAETKTNAQTGREN
jgi:hypothetical protein